MKILLLLLLGRIMIAQAEAQPASDSLNYPRIGRPCPDFLISNIKYFSKKQAALSDFKGKWLLLSFWNKFCPGCIASFSMEKKWQEKYKDRMQFISVGIQDKEQEIEPMYERYNRREILGFAISFDSLLAKRWQIFAGPYFMLIDPDGYVRARCYLNTKILDEFLAGGSPKLPPFNRNDFYEFEKDPRVRYDDKKPYLVNQNGGKEDAFSYRSLISEFDCRTQIGFVGPTQDVDLLQSGQFAMIGWPLALVYNYAFFGSIRPSSEEYVADPIIEVKTKDSNLFQYTNFGSELCENGFSYTLNLPPTKMTKEKLMQIMKQDLERRFGFKAGMEERKFSGWVLKVSGATKNKLKTKGGRQRVHRTSETEDYFATNVPWRDFVRDFRHDSDFRDFVDSTGITGNIDINLHCSFLRKNEAIDALKLSGLEMIPVFITKKALVIKDNE